MGAEMNVTLVRHSGAAALVEYADGEGRLRRVTIPAGEIVDGVVSEAELDRGIEYGLPWEELLALRVTPERVADELRRRGIWTAQDLRARPNEAAAALMAAYGVDVAALLKAAEMRR